MIDYFEDLKENKTEKFKILLSNITTQSIL
jgi:hypothetical protein